MKLDTHVLCLVPHHWQLSISTAPEYTLQWGKNGGLSVAIHCNCSLDSSKEDMMLIISQNLRKSSIVECTDKMFDGDRKTSIQQRPSMIFISLVWLVGWWQTDLHLMDTFHACHELSFSLKFTSSTLHYARNCAILVQVIIAGMRLGGWT